MDILDQAIEFEYMGQKFYKEKAEAAQHQGVKTILMGLAEDEFNHAKFLEGMKAGTAKEFPASATMPKVKNVIETSGLSDPRFMANEPGLIDVLNEALKIEERAKAHYTQEALATQSEENRKLLEQIAKEEQRHYDLISSLIKYIDAPKNILEDPEFTYYEED